MAAPSWDRIAEVFLQALATPPAERERFLDRACAGDDGLREEVDAMLVAESSGGLLLEERLLDRNDDGPASVPAGTRIGPWRIDALIGRGGMGEVYRAERADGSYRQTVAIKVLRPGYRAADAIRRFGLERQVLARLVHPDIAAILDGGTTADGRPYLVLQFVDGIPITDFCAQRRLMLADRLRLFLRVVNAVQFAHAHLVVHRDLKPSNILVQPDGTPRLLDFGIAKLLDRDQNAGAEHTRPEMRLMTPEHAAPEQLRGEAVSTATDVHGLGVLLYELVTGRRPFPAAGRTTAELEHAILTETPPAPSTVLAGAAARAVRGDLDTIILMALRKEPERRYASVGQLAEDVDRYLRGHPVHAQRDRAWYRARKFVGRNRGLVASVGVVMLLLATFAVVSSVQATRLAAERDREEAERAGAEDVVQILTNLVELANPILHPGGDTVRVAALLDEAESQVTQLADEPVRQARMWRVLGNMRVARGDMARARALLQKAYDTQVAARGRDDRDAAQVHHDLALSVLWLAGADSARPLLDSSVAEIARTEGPVSEDMAIAFQDRALVAANDSERRALIERAVAVREQLPGSDSVSIAALLNSQGSERYESHHPADALPLFEGSLRILEALLPPEHPNRLAVTRNVASALIAQGRYAEADSVQQLVRAAAERAHQTGAPEAGDLYRAGIIDGALGRLADADTLLRRSLDVYRQFVAPGHERLALSLYELGVVSGAEGRDRQGVALLDSALATRTGTTAHDRETWAFMAGERGLLLLHLGQRDEAYRELARADSVARRYGSADDAPTEVETMLGIAALATGRDSLAAARFAAAREQLEGRVPHGHPGYRGAGCGLGTALARMGRAAEATPLLRAECPAYERWGLADRALVEAERAARSQLPAAGSR